MWHMLDCSPRSKVIAVAWLHGVGLVYGLLWAVWNIVEEQRPLTEGDIFYMCVHLMVHVFLISSLVMGAKMGNAILILPWLIVSFPVFVSVSYYTLKYSKFNYLSQFIFNIFFVCLGWYLWLTVFQFVRNCKDLNQKPEKQGP